MKQEQMTEILMLTKRIGTLFDEVAEVSKELANAVDRRDEVSIQMILAMRAEPIEKLRIADRSLREILVNLETGDDLARIRMILNGKGDVAQTEQEETLAQQAAMNIRSHQKIMELDEIVNRKITKDKSIYNM